MTTDKLGAIKRMVFALQLVALQKKSSTHPKSKALKLLYK